VTPGELVVLLDADVARSTTSPAATSTTTVSTVNIQLRLEI
jgi:hypothetical protein